MKFVSSWLAIGPRIVHSTVPIYLILAFALLGSSSAQPTLVDPPGSQHRFDIKGRVVNAVTGEPLFRALVSFQGSESRSVLTDSDGSFAFEGVASTAVVFEVRKPGFVPYTPTFTKLDSAEAVLLKLTPMGVIRGKVVDENGEPIDEAMIQVFQQAIVNGRREWSAASAAQIRDDGTYRIPDLRPGKYLLAAIPAPPRNIQIGQTGYAETYYPKAPDRASASPIQVGAGEQVEADFELAPVSLYKVNGVVTGPKTLGVGVSLMDTSGNGVMLDSRMNPETGEFELRNVPRGRYNVRAMGYQQGNEPLIASTVITVANDVRGIVLPLHAPIKIPIKFVRQGFQESPTEAMQGMPAANVQAVMVGNPQSNGYANPDGSHENRTWMLHLQDSGTYNISVLPLRNGYVASARCGSTDLFSEPLEVSPSGVADPIEIVLRDDAATISASVRNGRGPELLVAVPESESNQLPVIWGCGPGAKCSSRPLAPGEYIVYAFGHGDEVEYANADFLKAYRSKAVHVNLAPNQTTEVTVDAIEAEP